MKMNYYDKICITADEDVYVIDANDTGHRGVLIRYLTKRNEVVLRDVVEFVKKDPAYFYMRDTSIIARLSKKYETHVRTIGVEYCKRHVKTVSIEDAARYVDIKCDKMNFSIFFTLLNSVYNGYYNSNCHRDNDGMIYYGLKMKYMWGYNGDYRDLLMMIDNTKKQARYDYINNVGDIAPGRKFNICCMNVNGQPGDFNYLNSNLHYTNNTNPDDGYFRYDLVIV